MAEKKKRVKANIPKDESNADRFVRVVSPRVGKALKAINVIGYCAGAGYEYTPAQIKQIAKKLSTAVTDMESQFGSKKTAAAGFEFDG